MFEIIKNATVGLGLALKAWLFRGVTFLCDRAISFFVGIKVKVKVKPDGE